MANLAAALFSKGRADCQQVEVDEIVICTRCRVLGNIGSTNEVSLRRPDEKVFAPLLDRRCKATTQEIAGVRLPTFDIVQQ
jgi:hypothetical protein